MPAVCLTSQHPLSTTTKLKIWKQFYRLTFNGNVCKISLGSWPRRLLNDGGSEGLGIWIDSFCSVNNFPMSSPQSISRFCHCSRDHSHSLSTTLVIGSWTKLYNQFWKPSQGLAHKLLMLMWTYLNHGKWIFSEWLPFIQIQMRYAKRIQMSYGLQQATSNGSAGIKAFKGQPGCVLQGIHAQLPFETKHMVFFQSCVSLIGLRNSQHANALVNTVCVAWAMCGIWIVP
jgi:hypothetical protein